jgi:hypothetical protein
MCAGTEQEGSHTYSCDRARLHMPLGRDFWRWRSPSGVRSRSDPACHDLKQLPHAKRFGEKIIGPVGRYGTFRSDMSGEENHRNMPGLLTLLHLSAQIASIFAWQQNIEQDQIGRVVFQASQTRAVQAGLYSFAARLVHPSVFGSLALPDGSILPLSLVLDIPFAKTCGAPFA